MADHAGDVGQGHGCTPAEFRDGLLRLPLPPPRLRIRPWWFPVQELRDPLVFYLEAWLADSIFGKRAWGRGWPSPHQSERGPTEQLSIGFPRFKGHFWRRDASF